MTTRRWLLLSALIIAMSTPLLYADEPPESDSLPGLTHIGLYIGTSFSHFSVPSSAPWDSRYGPIVGAYATYGMTDLLGLQMELVYNSKGVLREQLYDPVGDVTIPSGDIRLHYVQFAVLARINPPMNRYEIKSTLRPKLLLGFALGTLVRTKLKGSVNENNYHFQGNDLSLIFGGGFDYRVWGARKISFDFRFDLGMSHVYMDWRNNAGIFVVGVVF